VQKSFRDLEQTAKQSSLTNHLCCKKSRAVTQPPGEARGTLFDSTLAQAYLLEGVMCLASGEIC
jgi:hypothetical protein